MLLAVLLKNGRVGIGVYGPRELLVGNGKIKPSAVAAGEEVGKV